MQYGELFTQTWWLIWRNKLLWLLGLLLGIGGLLFNIFSRIILPEWIISGLLKPFEYRAVDIERYLQPLPLIGSVLGLFFFLAITWIVNAIAEGAMISSVVALERDKVITFRSVMVSGYRLLGRFVAIDTLLFLPAFVLFLALSLIIIGVLIALVLVGTQPGAEASEMKAIIIIGGVGSLIVLLPLLGITLMILALRILAFRGAAIEHLGTKASIKNAWRLLRSNLWSFIFLAVLLWGLRYLVGMPFRMIGLLLFIPGIVVLVSDTLGVQWPGILNSPILSLFGLVLVFSGGIINALLNAFSSSAWTLAYEEWVRDEDG